MRAWAIEYFLHDDKAMEALLEVFKENKVEEMLARIEEEPSYRNPQWVCAFTDHVRKADDH